MNYLKTIAASILVMITGCNSTPENTSKYLPAEKIKVLYEEGLGNVEAFLKVSSKSSLSSLLDFKKAQVKWAKVEGDSIMTMDEGKKDSLWNIVYEDPHPYVHDPKQPIIKMSYANVPGIHLKAFALSKEWAGIVYVHELSHLYDVTSGKEPLSPTREEYLDGETRAYMYERETANLLSHGVYDKVLDTEFNNMGSPTLEELFTKIRKNGPASLHSFMEKMDVTINSQKSLNEDEEALRL